MFHARPGLHQADGQQAEQYHQCQADIDRPEGEGEGFVFPHAAAGESPQAEQHEPQAQHAVNPEQRRMTVHGGGVEPLHIVKGDRRVDEEPEQTRPHQIPEGDGDKVIDRPFVRLDPGPGAG